MALLKISYDQCLPKQSLTFTKKRLTHSNYKLININIFSPLGNEQKLSQVSGLKARVY
jgi:hypothetical protein